MSRPQGGRKKWAFHGDVELFRDKNKDFITVQTRRKSRKRERGKNVVCKSVRLPLWAIEGERKTR